MKAAPLLLLAGAAVCFTLVIADEFSSGELYRGASSLRTDQTGASVWFEALAKLPGTHTERNYAPLDALQLNNSAIILLAVSPRELGDADFTDTIDTLAKAGRRVVIAINGSSREVIKPAKWNVELHSSSAGKSEDDDETEYFVPSADWHIFRKSAIDRTFGKGSVALISETDSFLNEAMRTSRDTPLLEWAAAKKPNIVFDESHLGSAQNGTVVGLLRRLRLQGFLAALIAASLLFVWRSSAPFPPVPELSEENLKLFGAGSGEALRNLLERRIPPSALIRACLDEWTRDFARRAGPDAVTEAEKAADAKAQPAEQWEKIRSTVYKSGKQTRTS
jgi:hypothetical protein